MDAQSFCGRCRHDSTGFTDPQHWETCAGCDRTLPLCRGGRTSKQCPICSNRLGEKCCCKATFVCSILGCKRRACLYMCSKPGNHHAWSTAVIRERILRSTCFASCACGMALCPPHKRRRRRGCQGCDLKLYVTAIARIPWDVWLLVLDYEPTIGVQTRDSFGASNILSFDPHRKNYWRRRRQRIRIPSLPDARDVCM